MTATMTGKSSDFAALSLLSHKPPKASSYLYQLGKTKRLELVWKNNWPEKPKKKKMNEELQQSLFEDYKNLFMYADGKQSRLPSSIDCGDGWESIIRDVCEYISANNSFIAPVREPFPFAYKLDVGFHNLCRKIERTFGLKAHSLYNQKLNKRYASFPGFVTKIVRIKEKFGTLKIYYQVLDNFTRKDVRNFAASTISHERTRYASWVAGVVTYAEGLSEKTCENDGSAGELNKRGWWKTLCPECASRAEKL